MDGKEPSSPTGSSPSPEPNARHGMGQLKIASVVGLVGQLLIWASVIALWVFGSIYSNIPVSTSLEYGATVLTISSAVIFALNYALVAGAFIALISLVLGGRGYQKVGNSVPRVGLDSAVAFTLIGCVGFGLFAIGWLVWLGSFVAPGAPPSPISTAYVPVLASNLSILVGLLLWVGGFLAFLGMLGNALGSSRVGSTYEETTVELGGVLSVLPVFSVLGYALSIVGLGRGERKLAGGWSPPPPPPPIPPAVVYTPFFPGGAPVLAPRPQEDRDVLTVVLVVVLLLVWVIVLPISVALLSGGFVYGPSNPPGGNVPSASSSAGVNLGVLLPLAALAATAVILPILVVRNRRKRQKSATSPPPPPPPTPPPPPAREEDHLDHLV